jgi:hypothetical protein
LDSLLSNWIAAAKVMIVKATDITAYATISLAALDLAEGPLFSVDKLKKFALNRV